MFSLEFWVPVQCYRCGHTVWRISGLWTSSILVLCAKILHYFQSLKLEIVFKNILIIIFFEIKPLGQFILFILMAISLVWKNKFNKYVLSSIFESDLQVCALMFYSVCFKFYFIQECCTYHIFYHAVIDCNDLWIVQWLSNKTNYNCIYKMFEFITI